MCPALQTDMKPELLTDPYESFMQRHLRYYGYFKENKAKEDNILLRPAQRNRIKEQEATDSDSDRQSSLDDQKNLIYSLLLESAVFKSRQIVFDNQEGQAIPRLSEPRDLFSTSKKNGLLKPPRWPTECEVIPEKISHVAYMGSYFTGSRAGGRRCATNAPLNMDGKNNNDLQFESRFESGNLQKVVNIGAHEYELTLRTDLYTSKHTQWFYFQVKNTRRGIPYRFTITNLMKRSSLYNTGLKPLMYSEHDAALRGEGWRREGGDIKYYRSSRSSEGASLYCLTWTFEFPHDNDTCYFAHCYPYTYSDLNRDLQRWTCDPARSQYCKLRHLCRSLAGNTVFLLTITSPSINPALAVSKKAVVVTARVHPGETNGSWMMKGFLDFILSDSPDAQLLRDTFIFKVIPMLNPDGVIVGNYRCSLSGRDLNRNYKSMLKDSFPCIWHTRAMVKRLLAEREILLYCDFHGHSRKNNVFMYGCNNKGEPESKLHERVFPLMLSKNAPDKFVFKGCKFKVQKSKEGTGRIVMWRHGIRNSYTMESTFCGSTLGDRKNTHFTTGDLESMGHHFCDTLLDYCDPDTTKFKVCLSEIHAFVREEIKEKLKRLGRDVDSDVNLSDISLSDIESSTSGSNSSESDGLPAHLLHIANKFCQKKKRLRSRKERNHMYQKRSSKHKLKSRDNADISEAPNQTAKSTNSKNSGKVDVEKKKLKTKSNESSLSQSDVVQTSTVQAAEKSSEKPILSYARKPDSVSVKTQLINRLPTSFVGDFSSVDHVCPRHATVKSREPAAGNRFPLIITVIQRASLPPYSKDSSPIKQHPPPFHAMLDFSNDRSHVSDHILKREKSFTSRPLVPAVGTKPYSFATTEKQKHLETSTVDLQLSLSPTGRKNSRVRQGSLIALVTSDYLDNLLLKPKKDASQSVQSLPILRKSDSFSMQASEDIAFSKMAVPSKSYVQPLDHTAVQTAAGLNMSKRTESGDHQKLGHSAVEKLQVNIKKEGENSLQGSLKKKGGRRSPTANPTVRQDRNKYSGLGVIALFFRVD
ncbi:cytosolic carboxypeptidase 2 isoform X3 [Hyla sarda]|uniref:cytosolic carboxypeptidase 2 isoform X3 n=1 Tax=Hyla sarda TaxID=327740 RepID=UPI0024C3EF1B|nr:cytosolic carboxypeptidase 2 isoform X3 [Hyla sarda]